MLNFGLAAAVALASSVAARHAEAGADAAAAVGACHEIWLVVQVGFATFEYVPTAH